jgi:hypothetical protein
MVVLGSGFCLFVSPDPGQQVLKVGAGELPLDGAELLFQVLTEREERPASRSPPTDRSAKRTCSREPG